MTLHFRPFILVSLFALGVASLDVAPASATDAGAMTAPAGSPLAGGIDEMTLMPGGAWRALKLRNSERALFISENGRWVIRGEVMDLWSGKSLTDYDEVVASTRTINFSGLSQIWDDLSPVELNQGEADPLILFTDPRCPYCRALIEELSATVSQRRILIFEIPLLGGQSGEDVRLVHCAEDQDAAKAALISHGARRLLSQRQGCDLGPLQRRLVTAQMIGVRAVPFMIDSRDGRFVEGKPDDLGAWLKGGGI